ncbi:MAG TPA: glycosyltransferase family 4 protein [Vicinamibacterales bacterium]|nr:glycosyltransferase family 4 protein [Vicinamibacterales bacterium]
MDACLTPVATPLSGRVTVNAAPLRVVYWTGIWHPGREGLSNEVAALRTALAPRARIVSFSAGQRSRLWPIDGVVRLSGRRYVLLHGLAAALERQADFGHVFGAVDAWHLLRVLGRRPVLFTVAIHGRPLPHLYDKVACFAAETPAVADVLVRAGISARRIHLVYPGVDLTRYRPQARASQAVRIVFASSPASVEDIGRRGIPLLVEAARLCPDVEVVLMWRPWGRTERLMRALDRLNPPSNVKVKVGIVPDIAAVYQAADATVFLPAAGAGKSCPNSVVEGLACGSPAILTPECGLAPVVSSAGAGVVIRDRTPAALAAAIREIAREPAGFGQRARALAERAFDARVFIERYAELYRAMSREGHSG